MLFKTLVILFAVFMISILVVDAYRRHEERKKRQRRFIHRYATKHRSEYWEILEAEYVRLRIERFGLGWWEALSAAHELKIAFFVTANYHDKEAVRHRAESLGIGLLSLIELAGDALFNYCKVIVAHEPYQRRVLGRNSIFESMIIRIHHQDLHEAIAEVTQTPFLYDGDSGGNKFWAIQVRDIFEPDHTEYLSLEDYSVIPLFEGGTTFNGKNWLEYIPPEIEEEEDTEEYEEEEEE